MEKGFTLVIPLYNKVKCIRYTLDSVFNNHGDYPFKCIIVDDDSTDGSSEIGEEYDVKYPDVFQYVKIKHHGHKTPVNARNFGIKLAETRYIGFLDADDELCAGFIDRGCMFLDEHPEYSMYGNGLTLRVLDENGEIKETTWNYGTNKINNFIDCLFAGAQDISFCASVYKTELVKDNLFTDNFCEDSIFKLKYIYKNLPIYIDNSTCESIVWNRQYNESYKWNVKRTNDSKIKEVFLTLKNELPGFKYEYEFINDETVALYEV